MLIYILLTLVIWFFYTTTVILTLFCIGLRTSYLQFLTQQSKVNVDIGNAIHAVSNNVLVNNKNIRILLNNKGSTLK